MQYVAVTGHDVVDTVLRGLFIIHTVPKRGDLERKREKH